MRALTSIAAATSLVAGTCLPTALAFATPPDVGGQSGAGSTDMTMVWQNPNQEYSGTGITDDTDPAYNPDGDGDGYGDNLAFTAPSKINFVAKASGELLAPGSSAIHIDNHSAYGIQVSSVKVNENTDDGWNIVEDQASAAGVANAVWGEIGPSGYALNWYGCKTAAAETAAGHWNMAAEGEASDADKLFLSTSGNVSNLSLDLSREKTFGTIQWFLKAGNAAVPAEPVIEHDTLSQFTPTELQTVSASLSSLGDNSPYYDEFTAYAASGEVWQSYELSGDTVADLPTAQKTISFRIIGVNHDDKADGTGKAGLTLMATKALPKTYIFNQNDDDDALGGWPAMTLRSQMNSGEIWLMMPEELRNAIVPVTKTSSGIFDPGSNLAAVSSTETLFLPSIIEVLGSDHYLDGWSSENAEIQAKSEEVLSQEGHQYAFFSSRISVVTDAWRDTTLVNIAHMTSDDTSDVWLRSIATDDRYNAMTMYWDETNNAYVASHYGGGVYEQKGIVPCFCL